MIVGCGFGGLFAAKALRRAEVDVTVIDRTNHHLFQPLLYQLAKGILSEGDIAPPIRDVLRHQRNTRIVLGEVISIDLDVRRVTVDTIGQRNQNAYDSLIVATGALQSYFGHPEFAHDAPGMKTIDYALELRGRIFGAFEMAERETDPSHDPAGSRSSSLARVRRVLSSRASSPSCHADRCAGTSVTSIRPRRASSCSTPPRRSCGAFPAALRERATRDLRDMGVEIHVGTMVTGVDEQGIDPNSTEPQARRIDAATKIWAARVRASRLGRLLAEAPSVELDRAGRVKVEADCTLPGHPEVFVIGDLMSLNNLPGVAQVAIQSGRHAAHTIIRRLAGDTTRRPFRYRDLGTMATISRLRAIAVLGRLRVSGFPAWVLWLVVHLMTLTGFKNRLSVLFNWTVAFLGRGRAQRVITARQVFARHALEAHARESSTAPPISVTARGEGATP